MSKTATKTPDDDGDRCPNCGYCEHCGQSTKPAKVIERIVERPRPYITQPWRETEGVPYKVWCASTIKGIRPEQVSISCGGNEYSYRKEAEC